VHASRSPERGLELYFDLLALDDALSLRGAPAPVEVSRAIDRLSAALRFFMLADGRLPSFHGGEAGAPARIAAALALDADRGPPPSGAPYGDYQRLEGGGLQLIADVGAPPHTPFDADACAQAGAIEIIAEGRRLVVACGHSAKVPSAELQGARGGSCVAVDAAPDAGWATRVKAERNDSPQASWLDIAHDGWRKAAGLDHTRRLFLDPGAGELRGEDHLAPAAGRRASPATFEIAFRLAPGVSAQIAADGTSALIRPAGAAGWRLRSDAAQTRLTPAVAFEDGEPRATQALVLAGAVRAADGARIRWKLSRDEA